MSGGVVCVLGMHRSGTSCLAGCLEEAGLFLGEVNTRAPANAKGNRENLEIMTLHDAVLQANGGSWSQPVDQPRWSPEHLATRDRIIASYPAGKRWGFKDPRSLACLSGWLEALPGLVLLGTFRHPSAVAASLDARRANRLEREQGLGLWADYNRRLLQCCRDHGVRLVNYDWPAERYLARLRQLVAALGLREPEAGFSFYEPALRHQHAAGDDGIPAALLALHAELAGIAERQFLEDAARWEDAAR